MTREEISTHEGTCVAPKCIVIKAASLTMGKQHHRVQRAHLTSECELKASGSSHIHWVRVHGSCEWLREQPATCQLNASWGMVDRCVGRLGAIWL